MSNKKSKDLTKNKNIDKKEKTFCQVNEKVRSDSVRRAQELLKESEPIFNLYLAQAILKEIKGKFPKTIEEYRKNSGKFYSSWFHDSKKDKNKIIYWIDKHGELDHLYEFEYISK